MLLQLLVNGFIKGCMYALAGIGFSLVYNTSRVFHIAYAGLFVVAAYLISQFDALGIGFTLGVVLSCAITATLSIACEVLIYQPLKQKDASPNTLLISSLGVFIVAVNLMALLHGSETRMFSTDFSPVSRWGDLALSQSQITQLVVSVILLGIFWVGINQSKVGLIIRALKDDEQQLKILGFNSIRIRYVIYGVSGVIIAVVAFLRCMESGVEPYGGLPVFLYAVVAMIIGGLGRLDAVILGGLILGIAQGISNYFFDLKWENAISFSLLLVVLVFFPKGIFSGRQRSV